MGPAHFGIEWDFAQALRLECRLLGRTTEPGPQAPDFSGLGIDAPTDGDHAGGTVGNWIELSHRRLLLQWARENGVSCPSGVLTAYREKWEREHPMEDRGEWLAVLDLNLATYRSWLDERATAGWITSQGPKYFGFWWAFEQALFRELQITGRAAQLVANR